MGKAGEQRPCNLAAPPAEAFAQGRRPILGRWRCSRRVRVTHVAVNRPVSRYGEPAVRIERPGRGAHPWSTSRLPSVSSPGPDGTAAVRRRGPETGQNLLNPPKPTDGTDATDATDATYGTDATDPARHRTGPLGVAVAERAGHPDLDRPDGPARVGGDRRPAGASRRRRARSPLTPLRVCLLMAILILIFGWLFKSACIQKGANGRSTRRAAPVDHRLLQRRRPALRQPQAGHPVAIPTRPGRTNRTARASGSGRSDQVTVANGQVIGTEPGNTQVLSDNTLIGNEETGYSKVENGLLVPIDDSESARCGTWSTRSSPATGCGASPS